MLDPVPLADRLVAPEVVQETLEAEKDGSDILDAGLGCSAGGDRR
jgi:hypothetical protein